MSIGVEQHGASDAGSADDPAGAAAGELMPGPAAGILPPPGAEARRPRTRRRVGFWLAAAWLGVVLLAAVAADLLPLEPYDAIVTDLPSRTPPRLSLDEPLGTDALGRSVLSRIVFGARQSLIVGFVSVGGAMVVGVALGMLAGFFRGRLDGLIGIVINAILSVPALVLLLAVAAIGQRNITTLLIGLTIIFIPYFTRLSRSSALAQAQREYVIAARVMGAGPLRILTRELLPHILLTVTSYAFLLMGIAVVAEGSLSFLGLGIPPPAPSWGGMVNSGREYLEAAPALAIVPSICLLLTVLALTVIGEEARRRFDTRRGVR